MLKTCSWTSRFMGSTENYIDADIIMVGAPMDFTVSYRPGTRYGPQKIRETSYGLEEYSPYLNRDLVDCKYFDAGDLELPFGNVEKSVNIIGQAAKEIYDDNKTPLFIGGEHLISYPVIKEAFNKYGNSMLLIHFDAHADLRLNYMGQEFSHAAVIRKSVEFISPKNIFQFGIRSCTADEYEWATKNINFFPFNVLEPFKSQIEKFKDHPIYITIDIDVFDPAYACGTGTPEPGGCNPGEMFEVIKLLKDFNIIGLDIVEVSPVYDPSDRTPILAAKIIREAILSFL